ncbi:MAG: NAD(+)/NADH kinase [Spirochaetaceae bacterium]|nr:NAD(+)/NADH kinase [Spirochaetaceae bacterium]
MMKNAVVITNIFNPQAVEEAGKVEDFLQKNGFQTTAYEFDGKNDEEFTDYDLAVSLGGDGTVLFAARACLNAGIRIFPINFGKFGFLSGVDRNHWQEKLSAVISGGEIEELNRSMLQIVVIRDNKPIFTRFALNDLVLCGESPAKTVYLTTSYNGINIGEFAADGIILSSATGSTAYSLSAGGPILDPTVDAMILSMINPFTISDRPLVLSPNSDIRVMLSSSRNPGAVIIVDGQIRFNFLENDILSVKRAEKQITLLGCSQNSFYSALRSKLHWQGGDFA